MYQRRIKPYQFGLPPIPEVRHGMMQGTNVQTTDNRERQQQGMPNIPSGLLDKMLSGSPQLTDGFLSAGMAPSGMDAAIASATPNLGFTTPYLDSLVASGDVGLMDTLGTTGAFDLGTAGTGAGFGMGAGEAGLLGSGAASGAATGATAAGEAGAAGSAASSAGMMGPWAPITIAAMIAKSQVQGSDPSSPAGVADTLLLPSIDQWMANPARSAGNTLDPFGTAIGDVTGVGDEPWYALLSPSGLFNLF